MQQEDMEIATVFEQNGIDFQGLQKKVGGYILGQMMGEGRFSQVFYATHLLTSEKVAMKVVCKMSQQSRQDHQFRDSLRKEATALRHLHHPNIIGLFEVLETENNYYMAMEVADKGALTECLIFRSGFDESEARHIFRQLVSAVEYLHRHGVAHRRITPDNILFDEEGKVKLTGFRSDRHNFHFYSYTEHKRWDLRQFIAPESLPTSRSTKGDIWSLGVNLNLILTGTLPFGEETDSCWLSSSTYEPQAHLTEDSKDLLRQMITIDEDKRINMKDLLRHEWVTRDHGLLKPHEKEQAPTDSLDQAVIQYMTKQYNFDESDIRTSVRENRVNYACATYRLLLRKMQSRDSAKSLPYKSLDLRILDHPKSMFQHFKSESTLQPPKIDRTDIMHYMSGEPDSDGEDGVLTSRAAKSSDSGIDLDIGVAEYKDNGGVPYWTGKVTITTSRMDYEESDPSQDFARQGVLDEWEEEESDDCDTGCVRVKHHMAGFNRCSPSEPRDIQWSRQLAKRKVSFPSIKTVGKIQEKGGKSESKDKQRHTYRDSLVKFRNLRMKHLPRIRETQAAEIKLEGSGFMSRQTLLSRLGEHRETMEGLPSVLPHGDTKNRVESAVHELNISKISTRSEIFSCNSYPVDGLPDKISRSKNVLDTDSIGEVLSMKKLATRHGKGQQNGARLHKDNRNKYNNSKNQLAMAKEILVRNETTTPEIPRVPPNSALRRKPRDTMNDETRKEASMNLLFNFQMKLDKCEDEFYENYKFKTRLLDSDKFGHHDNTAMPRKGVSKRRARNISKEIHQYGSYNPYDKELLASTQKLSCYYSLPDIRKQIENSAPTLHPHSTRHKDDVSGWTWNADRKSFSEPIVNKSFTICIGNNNNAQGQTVKLPSITHPNEH